MTGKPRQPKTKNVVRRSRSKTATPSTGIVSPSAANAFSGRLFSDLRNLVRSARQRVAVAVNSEAISLYWQVGCRIKKDILKGGRGTYGEETVKKCAAFLTGEFGSGWGFRTIQHCVRVAYTFTEAEIVYALRTQLSWTHVRALMGDAGVQGRSRRHPGRREQRLRSRGFGAGKEAAIRGDPAAQHDHGAVAPSRRSRPPL